MPARAGHSLAAMTLALLCACGRPATFTEVREQVFRPSCQFSACHQGSAPAGGLSLETDPYERLVGAESRGAPGRTLVVPGDPAASYLYEKLSSPRPAAGTRMPPTNEPAPEQVEAVRSWIADGAKRN